VTRVIPPTYPRIPYGLGDFTRIRRDDCLYPAGDPRPVSPGEPSDRSAGTGTAQGSSSVAGVVQEAPPAVERDAQWGREPLVTGPGRSPDAFVLSGHPSTEQSG